MKFQVNRPFSSTESGRIHEKRRAMQLWIGLSRKTKQWLIIETASHNERMSIISVTTWIFMTDCQGNCSRGLMRHPVVYRNNDCFIDLQQVNERFHLGHDSRRVNNVEQSKAAAKLVSSELENGYWGSKLGQTFHYIV